MSHSLRRPSGQVFIGDEAFDTVQCVHCGRHWVWRPGSGKKRGFCMNCGGFHCGSEECHRCLPMEKMLEEAER